ncbi:hypothetical protein AB1N83_012166 [Pleurotus pulmonarius]
MQKYSVARLLCRLIMMMILRAFCREHTLCDDTHLRYKSAASCRWPVSITSALGVAIRQRETLNIEVVATRPGDQYFLRGAGPGAASGDCPFEVVQVKALTLSVTPPRPLPDIKLPSSVVCLKPCKHRHL